MTYCFGLRYRESVYLLADSAVTRYGAPPSSPVTSFGESSVSTALHSIDEGCLKILRVGADCFVAFAAVDIKRAIDAVAVLRGLYAVNLSIPELFTKLAANLELSNQLHFEYLIARSGASGPELWHWSTTNPTMTEEVREHKHIGSLATWHADMGRFVAASFNGLPEDRMLFALAATIQGFGLRDAILAQGVGGVVAALRLGSLGPEWLPDTHYIMGSGDSSTPTQAVSLAFRDDRMIVWSTFNQEFRFFTSGSSESDVLDWLSKRQAQITDEMKTHAARLWVFLGTTGWSVLILDTGTPTADTPVIRISRKSENVFIFSFHAALKAYLELPLEHRNDGSMAMRFGFVTSDGCLAHLMGVLNRVSAGPS